MKFQRAISIDFFPFYSCMQRAIACMIYGPKNTNARGSLKNFLALSAHWATYIGMNGAPTLHTGFFIHPFIKLSMENIIWGQVKYLSVGNWLNDPIYHPLHRFFCTLLSSPGSTLLLCFFLIISFLRPLIKQALATLKHPPPSSFFSFFSSYFLSLLISTPEGVLCLLTSWSKASAGLRLAPIIRAWQGAAVSTCQPNKHPLWHPSGCVWRGVSQPPSSGPLISWMAHSAYTSTRLLCSGQAAIVLPCKAILTTLIILEAFCLVWDMVIKRKAERERELKEVSNTGQVWQHSWAAVHLVSDCLFQTLTKYFW